LPAEYDALADVETFAEELRSSTRTSSMPPPTCEQGF